MKIIKIYRCLDCPWMMSKCNPFVSKNFCNKYRIELPYENIYKNNKFPIGCDLDIK